MSTQFSVMLQRAFTGLLDWGKGEFHSVLVWSLPAGIDPQCANGCDVLSHVDVSDMPEMLIATGLPDLRLRTYLSGDGLGADDQVYTHADLAPALARMRDEPGLEIAGRLIYQVCDGRRIPILLSGDGGFPITRRMLEGMHLGDTLTVATPRPGLFSFA